MDTEMFGVLEKRVEALLEAYSALKQENARLSGENRLLLEERNGFKARIDAILAKLEGI